MAGVLNLGLGLGLPQFTGEGVYTFANAEAAALVARFTVPPTNARKALIDTLVGSLKAAGIWTKLDALCILAAHDAQAARQNWIANQYNATAVASPSFTVDRGYTTDGVASYLDTNFNPVTASSPKFTQNSASVGMWSRTAAQNVSSWFGWYDGTDGITLNPRTTTDAFTYRINQTPAGSSANLSGIGFYTANRSAAAATQSYKNGAAASSGTDASIALNSVTLKLGTAVTGLFASGEVATYFIGQSLTGPENTAFYNAINTYLTGVGA